MPAKHVPAAPSIRLTWCHRKDRRQTPHGRPQVAGEIGCSTPHPFDALKDRRQDESGRRTIYRSHHFRSVSKDLVPCDRGVLL
jgi:hypothetical protein